MLSYFKMNLLMKKILWLWLCLLCGPKIAASRFQCCSQTSLATFNVGLVPFSVTGTPALEDRTALLIEELSEGSIDIICLQEIFFADFQRQVYGALKDTYPYVVTATDLTADDNDSSPACSASDLQAFGGCLETQCPGLPEDQLVACASLSCAPVLSSLQCVDCISLYLLTGDFTVCGDLQASRFERNYGLMLLSRKELTNTRASGYTNQSQFDGYLEASVRPLHVNIDIFMGIQQWLWSEGVVDGIGDLICTHLSSVRSTEIYFGPPIGVPPQYSTYDEQQYAELLILFELVTTKDEPILMGDLNNGPASPGVTWYQPWHYGLINARGLVCPYVLDDGRCTFCTDNLLVAANIPALLIDHICIPTDSYKGRVISSKRIFDSSMTASGVPLSDHYGVSVTLKDTRSECRWWERRRYYCPAQPELQLLPLPPPQAELTRLCAAI